MTDIGISATRPEPDITTAPRRPASAPITYMGYRVCATGFTPESFTAAIDRALACGITLVPGRAAGTWLVRNPTNGMEYVTSARHGCSCRATGPCKHRALVLLVEAMTRGP